MVSPLHQPSPPHGALHSLQPVSLQRKEAAAADLLWVLGVSIGESFVLSLPAHLNLSLEPISLKACLLRYADS